MKWLLRYSCLLAALVLQSFIVLGQQYNFTSYSAEHGVESQVLSLYQDSRGYIWIGTQGGGVNRFDGVAFVNYSKTNGLANNTVNAIVEDNDGNMWFGTDNGLDMFDGKTFTHFDQGKDGLSNISIKDIEKDKAGNLWICTLNGIDVMIGGRFTIHYNQANGLRSKTLSAMFKDTKDNIWVIYDDTAGMSVFDGQKFNYYKPEGNKNVSDGATDSRGITWFNCQKEGIYSFNGKQFHHYTMAYLGFQPNQEANYIFFDSRHNMWVGIKGSGIVKYRVTAATDGSDSLVALKHFSKEDGLGDDEIYSVMEDKAGNIWLGTNGGGVSKYSGDKFVHYTEREGSSTSVFGIFEDANGGIWVTGDGETYKSDDLHQFKKLEPKDFLCDIGPYPTIGPIFKDNRNNLWFRASSKSSYALVRFDGKVFCRYTVNDGMLSEHVYASCIDKQGNVLFITDKGVIKFDPAAAKGQKSFSTLVDFNVIGATKAGLIHSAQGDIGVNNVTALRKMKSVDAMITDSRNNLWFAVNKHGVFRYDGNKLYHYPGNGLADSSIAHISEDTKGTIWLAGDVGVNKYNGTGFDAYTKKQNFSNESVNAILTDTKGNVWFGTDGDGIIKYNGKKFIHLKDSIRMNNSIMGLVFDNDSNLWAATNSGIVKIKWRLNRMSYKVYGKDEGFAGIECNQDAICKDHSGNLWFGTAEMLTRYNPNEEAPDTVAPQTHITEVNLFYDKTNWGSYSNALTPWYKLPINITLPYYNNHITFQYVGVTQRSQNIAYRIILDGLDKDWSPETDKREITYSNLPPGKYVFKVLSRNADGVWNKEASMFSFTIAPPWWQTWWFYTLALLIVGLGIYGFITWRMRALKLEKIHLESIITERTAEVVKQKALVEEKNKDVVDSITYAKRLQDAILPSLSSIKKNLPESFVLYKPKDIVAGDFYWMDKVGDSILIAACDCTGHGVPGAMISIVCSNALNRAVKEFKIRDTGKLLDQTRDIVLETFKKSESYVHDGMDISFCAINLKEKHIEWSGANNPLWIIKERTVSGLKGKPGHAQAESIITELEPDKQPIGKQDNEKPFTTHNINIEKGDTLYLFTDGFADQFGGPKGKKFKYKQLKEKLVSMVSLSMDEQKKILERTLENWKGNLEQVDDILLIGIRI